MTESIFEPHVLREYALLADGHRGALIGPRGDVCWMCAPRWDDDAVFASLIGGRSVFAITPTQRFVWGGHYEEGSLIWRSRWVTHDGIIECREALAFPGDPQRAILLRRLLAVRGDADVQLVFSPAAGFDRRTMARLARDDQGCWHADVGDLRLRLAGVPHASVSRKDGLALRANLTVPEGGFLDIVVELSVAAPSDPLPDAGKLWERTETHWRATVPSLDTSIAPHDARHSYAVLRGMTPPGGGTVAAATMSLPEHADTGRNYDYRYVWIRDQCYVGQAMAADGPHPLLDDAAGFIAQRVLADGPDLKPAYTVAGGPVPGERSLRLPGYPGERRTRQPRASPALIPLLHRKSDRSWREHVEEQVSSWWTTVQRTAMTGADPINPMRIFWELSQRIPADAIVTADSGSAANWYARHLKFPAGVRGSLSGTLATMGPGVPYVIGAKWAHPDRPAIAFAGDGAMQMNGLAELITIAKYWQQWSDPRLIIAVLHNNDLNQVTWEMRAMENSPKFPETQNLPDVDYAAFARSLGLHGANIDDPEALGPAWDQALAADRPTVLDVRCDPDVPPIPPHATYEQVKSLVQAVIGGDEDTKGFVKQGIKQKLQQYLPNEKQDRS
ncbi:thiamine pyrophosphate-dependent enzyme [Mycobacterium sp. DBP42]|uniref:thiamine pyrophosphate-dependent enzyme n=1 Tax=Mycobacterium sp. DBP42 TaxID=2545267 RepID=UPI0020181146|nr:thiamine pyrophosphate-dependent enzyme [Mycobacterium sp. DBP42]